MTKEEYLARHITMKRLLDIFSATDGGSNYLQLREFTDKAEGEAISRILKHMGALLDVANVATDINVDNLPDWVKKHAKTLS